MNGKIVGIDLGTTNSALAVRQMTVRVVPNRDGGELTPSIVTSLPKVQAGASDDEVLVGRQARDLMKQYPGRTAQSVKRLMGREFDEPEVQKIALEKPYGFAVETDPTEPGSVRVVLGDLKMSPEEISALILRKVVGDAEMAFEGPVSGAVVTVPAYFSDRQKFATRAACEQAGLSLLRLLPEPTAAALAFGVDDLPKDSAANVMVFDLGGGTFDVSILSIAGGQFMEVTKGGDMWLGGDDIDALIRDHVLDEVSKGLEGTSVEALLSSLTPLEQARFAVEIKERCEQAKIALSSERETLIDLYGLLKDANGRPIDAEVTLTRDRFESLLEPKIERLVSITEGILEAIRFEPELIDTVLMVGGSSLIPAVQNALKRTFGEEKVRVHPRPMFAVVEGAALLAHRLAGETRAATASTHEGDKDGLSLMHSTAHDYYLQLASGNRAKLVERNSPLPMRVEKTLRFSHEHQWVARLRVFNEVDGILETVGEVWFDRDQADVFATDVYDAALREGDSKPELTLAFEISENNLISMEAWHSQKKELRIQSVIARGGLAVRLFSELESALSDISSRIGQHLVFKDYVRLSRLVTSTIARVSDPVTGLVSAELKKKASLQVQALKDIALSKTPPLHVYFSMKRVRQGALAAFPADVQQEIVRIFSAFETALMDLVDGHLITDLADEWRDLADENDGLSEIEEALQVVAQGRIDWPSQAKRMDGLVQGIVSARTRGDLAAFERKRGELREALSEFSGESGRRRAHFDRDVELT